MQLVQHKWTGQFFALKVLHSLALALALSTSTSQNLKHQFGLLLTGIEYMLYNFYILVVDLHEFLSLDSITLIDVGV